MRSWWSPSLSPPIDDERSAVARRFVEASRRAEIIEMLNAADTDRGIAHATADELCEALEAEIAFVVVTDPETGERDTIAAIGLADGAVTDVASDPLSRGALGLDRPEVHDGEDLLGLGIRHLVLSPWRARQGRQVLIGVGRLFSSGFDEAEVALAEAVTASAGRALERIWLGAERDRQSARQASLARAARSLSASLVAAEVLHTLSVEARRAFQADAVVVYGVDDGRDLRVVAGAGIDDATAWDHAHGKIALCARVMREDGPRVAPRFGDADANATSGPAAIRSGMAVPIRPQTDIECVVLVGFHAERRVGPDDLDLLAAFADLGAMAYRNAADHAAAQRAAAVDSLTGCLNHGAFQDRLREEIARAERSSGALAVALLDLNEFKSVNDTLGHLAGDALLRGVAEALRRSVRSYDQVARYGGDEFALLLPATDEASARCVVERALAAVASLPGPDQAAPSASAGLGHWRPGDDADALIARADRALLQVKRARRREPAREADPASVAAQREDQRLRRLATAGALGTRLSRLLDERAIAETAVIELGAALGYQRCVLVRQESGAEPVAVAAATEQGTGTGAIDEIPASVRRALSERRTVLTRVGTDLAGNGGCSELAVPVYVGGELWGALGLRSGPETLFDDDDAQLVQSVADHLGAALRTAGLYANLDQTHLGTAAALAAALEAKDSYTADHAQSIADLAASVGTELGLDEERLRDLRYGAIFHDIGKIAIPDAILNKPGPLTEAEFAVIRTHPEVGEQILKPVPFLARVREIVRHDHERWDGGGYPDGLRGEDIPLGARIVLVVDAYHAMRSDRPYRRALSASAARADLLRHAGTQFDPRVVDALLAVLEREPDAEPV
jgi:diguanylate cyclase (GGDEF)-like protein/putative nucleotidyltransferase with HDIG domain